MKLSGLISHLRAAWAYARFVPILSSLDHEDVWTKEYAEDYTRFSNSPAGQMLRARAQRLLALSAVNATRAPQDQIKRECNRTSGLTTAFTWLDSHLAQPEPETEAESIAEEAGEFV